MACRPQGRWVPMMPSLTRSIGAENYLSLNGLSQNGYGRIYIYIYIYIYPPTPPSSLVGIDCSSCSSQFSQCPNGPILSQLLDMPKQRMVQTPRFSDSQILWILSFLKRLLEPDYLYRARSVASESSKYIC